MQNIRSRIFVIVATLFLLLGLVSCKGSDNTEKLKITFGENNYEVLKGETIQLTPTFENGTIDATNLVWTVANSEIATVDAGVVTGVKKGNTTITVSYSEDPTVSTIVTVKVLEKEYFPVVIVNPVKEKMELGETQTLSATIEGTNFESVVTYKSLNENVATVNELGLITAVGKGSTIVTIKVAEKGNELNFEEYSFLVSVNEEVYVINYIVNGGKLHEDTIYSYTDSICPVYLYKPIREGYQFLGWYTDSTFADETRLNEISEGYNKDVTLYAKWEIIEYQIAYELDYGSLQIIDRTAEEVVDLYLKDFSIYTNKTYTKESYLENEHMNDIQVEFFYDNCDKWGWLINFLIQYCDESKANSIKDFYKYTNFYDAYRDGSDIVDVLPAELKGIVGGTKYSNSITSSNDYSSWFTYDVMPFSGFVNFQTYTIYSGNVILPEAEKFGYKFLGWYDENDQVVTSISSDLMKHINLKAKWEIIEYNVNYNFNEGNWPIDVKDFEVFRTWFMTDYNSYGMNVISWSRFHVDSKDNIKVAFSNREYLAKYNWLFKYMLEEMQANIVANNLQNTETSKEAIELLNKLISGDIDAINGSYANGRTVIRHFIHNLLNKNHESTGDTGGAYLAYIPNFANSEVIEDFMSECNHITKYTVNDGTFKVLEPIREGYNFLGWYDNPNFEGDVVSTINSSTCEDIDLYAKWEQMIFNIDYQLSYGEWKFIEKDANEAFATVNITRYLNYEESGGTAISLHNNASGKYWRFITLKETGQNGVYQIQQIVYGSSNITEEYDLVIAWYPSGKVTDTVSKNALENIYSKRHEYANALVWFDNVPNYEAINTNIKAYFTTCDNLSVTTYTKGVGVSTLPTPFAMGANFIGWYDDPELTNKVTSISTTDAKDFMLYAGWEPIEYKITYELDGGTLYTSASTMSEFAEEFINDYNSYLSSTSAKATIASFHTDSRDTVKEAFSNPEMLEKYNWLLKYILNEVVSNASNRTEQTSAYPNIVYVLQQLVGGNTEVIKGDKNGDGRTLLRNFINNIINETDWSADSVYKPYLTDFGEYREKNYYFGVIYFTPDIYYYGEEIRLPIAIKDGYEFMGWKAEFSEMPEENVMHGWIQQYHYGDVKLTAQWNEKNTITYKLDEGNWVGSFKNLAEFANEFVADFNAAAKTTSVTVTSFHTTSHTLSTSPIKVAFANAEMLAKYKWLFEYIKQEISANYPDGTYASKTIELLNKLIAGDTTAIVGEYADARTIIRRFIHNLINQNNEPVNHTEAYNKYVTDFSLEENINKFNSLFIPKTSYSSNEDTFLLPVAVRNGYTFLGWFDADGNKVTEIKYGTNGDIVLTAKWELIA